MVDNAGRLWDKNGRCSRSGALANTGTPGPRFGHVLPVLPRIPEDTKEMASITIKSGSQAGLSLDITEGEMLIGRAEDCEIRVADKAVSGRHCAILNEEGRYWIRDLESTNGTRLNGGLVKESRLKPGDMIMIGSVEMIVEGDDILVDDSVPKTPPRSASVPTVVMSSGLNADNGKTAEQVSSAFETRQNGRLRWLLLGVAIATALIGLGYWFLSVLFQ